MHTDMAIGAFGLLAAAAAASDVAQRRIANHLTVPLLAGGLGAQYVASGWGGSGDGLAAAAIVFALLWVPWRRSWLGGGDLKLAAAAAAWVGTGQIAAYLSAAALIAGAMGVVSYVASSRSARAQMRSRLRAAARGLAVEAPIQGGGGRTSVPAGAAFAAAALLVLLTGGTP
jgi:prepilin peptidase CpaA